MNLIINLDIMYMNEYMDRWFIIVNLHQIDHIFEHYCIMSSGTVVIMLQMWVISLGAQVMLVNIY